MDVTSLVLGKKYTDEKTKAVDDKLTEHKEDYTTLSGFIAQNLVVNGTFDNAKTSWASAGPAGTGGSTTIVPNYNGKTNSLKIINILGTRREEQVIPTIPGHRYYYRCMAYIESYVSGNPLLRFDTGNRVNLDITKIGEWQSLSLVSSAIGVETTLRIGAETSSTFTIAYDDILVIDLDELFGTGVALLSNYIMKQFLDKHITWFDGYKNNVLSLKSIFNFYDKEIERIKNTSIVGYIDNPLLTDFAGQALVTLSYDDGILNNYDLALPLHEKHGIPATFNVISSRFAVSSFLSEALVRNCYNRGVEIASHGHYHDAQWITKTDEEIHFECSESKRLLNLAIGADAVDTIAIPFSAYDDRVKSIVQQYYKGVRVYGAMQNAIPPTDRYKLNSAIAVENTTTFANVKAKIDEAVANKQWCIIMLHSINNNAVKTTYEISQALLDEILTYINQLGRNVILPVNTKDALKFVLGASY